MAFQQATNKGTLIPGQTISVNKYTVQVERYLSQGGFAHVYLVRTPTPVYGTTHHVLKRIAVPNESMLTEVKKEVDIMRILKGHPNIVHLVDAAWHRTSTGVYEVFILMEFCGGIIDMMNRRLRERLTEAEILQIFVDVCEGVAAMHNLRPALLHRDLKVENILQSSDTLFKLCDFGSAVSAAARLPANTQEIRVLEADLNRHTTLQYRAPEMVDPYLRRPIDEKSDVWALGVLLYKLCYYTTPFEEHGPLAILNVQYKIPPYPIYSAQMNSLIASMLREHGAQRPTVFEVLNVVHRIRGTKSKFAYTVPSRPQLGSHLATEPPPQTSAPLDGLISYRASAPSVPQSQAPPSLGISDKNAAIQAREKVLEAIAPLRRGRPAPVSLHHATTGPASPTKEKAERKLPELEFKDAEDESWKAARGAVRGHRSGLASPTTWPPPVVSLDDAWSVMRESGTDADKAKNRDRRKTLQGSLSGLGGFGDSFDDGLALSSTAPVATSSRLQETTSRFRAPNKPKDAFEGLGLSSDRAPAPTLGEVQKARTGMGVGAPSAEPSSGNLVVPGKVSTSHTPASSSPRPSPSPRLLQKTPSPVPPTSVQWRPSPSPFPQSQSSVPKVDLSVEQRFPALEELDRALLSSASAPPPHAPVQRPPQDKPGLFGTAPAHLPHPSSYSAIASTSSQRTGSKFTQTFVRDGGGIRSEETTGPTALEQSDAHTPRHERTGSHLQAPSPSRIPRLPSRAHPPRRQSSLALRPQPVTQGHKSDEPPSPAQIMGRPEPQDWLTGPDEDSTTGRTTSKPVLKESSSKRSSVIVERGPQIPSPQKAVAVSEKRASPPPRQLLQPKPGLPSVEPRISALPPGDSWLPAHKRRDTTSTTSSDDGPEEATAHGPPRLTSARLPVRVEAKETGGVGAGRRRRSKSKGRQSSVHELVDLWGGKEGRGKSSGGVDAPSTGPKSTSQEPEDVISSSKPLLFPPALQSPKPRSASPQPLTSPSISTDSTRREPPSPTRRSPRHRKPSTNGRDAGPPPSTSAGTATARPRPQSMFLNSPTAVAVKFPVPSPIDSSSNTGLDVPAPDARAQRTVRRTSITNIVQRYEAIGGNAGASPIVRQPSNPASPSGVSLSRSMTTHVSPSPRRGYLGAVGLPGLAADASSKKPPTGIGILDRDGPRAAELASSSVGLPGLAVEEKPSSSSLSLGTHGGHRSPMKLDATGGGGGGGLDPPARLVQKRTPSPAPPIANDDAQQPSPERPYQGVGRLIDQWQRKTADAAEPPRSPVSRRRGGGGASTSATASPRRAGVLAGRGAQD
ncbi:hypothetical protein B0F90DRAFT_1682161 [Multifurca ochricompacta]|uniref:non-specific serine/threonine protein kinase n=1 Tax=Multifurca ochricompacta TaxID=376703 RepID=A0AAD4ME32_9AGAM|nr:hypothetical protein B0F90DRAFT_1682161 [Multifurca ochricompacta]